MIRKESTHAMVIEVTVNMYLWDARVEGPVAPINGTMADSTLIFLVPMDGVPDDVTDSEIALRVARYGGVPIGLIQAGLTENGITYLGTTDDPSVKHQKADYEGAQFVTEPVKVTLVHEAPGGGRA